MPVFCMVTETFLPCGQVAGMVFETMTASTVAAAVVTCTFF